MEVVSNGKVSNATTQQKSSHRRSVTQVVGQNQNETLRSIDNAKEKSPSRGSAFDPYTHKVPGLDRFGFNTDPMSVKNMFARHTKNVLAEPVDVPKWWSGKRLPSTKTEDIGAKDTLNSDRSGMRSVNLKLEEKMTRTKLIE